MCGKSPVNAGTCDPIAMFLAKLLPLNAASSKSGMRRRSVSDADQLGRVLVDCVSGLADLDEAIRLESENASFYLNRGGIYHVAGDARGGYEEAIKDYDNAVRLCPNYETDFINDKFMLVYGKDSVERAIKLLDSIVNDPPISAADYYYTGVQSLFS